MVVRFCGMPRASAYGSSERGGASCVSRNLCFSGRKGGNWSPTSRYRSRRRRVPMRTPWGFVVDLPPCIPGPGGWRRLGVLRCPRRRSSGDGGRKRPRRDARGPASGEPCHQPGIRLESGLTPSWTRVQTTGGVDPAGARCAPPAGAATGAAGAAPVWCRGTGLPLLGNPVFRPAAAHEFSRAPPCCAPS
jgi:hypothetical protein